MVKKTNQKKATADKILTLKTITISYILVHFFSDKETKPKKSPAHALFTLSKIKYINNVLNSQGSNSRTKNVAIFLSLPIADSYRKKMLKCGKKFGVIKDFFHSIKSVNSFF